MSTAPDSTQKTPSTITVLYFAAASTATGLTTERVPLTFDSVVEPPAPHGGVEGGFPLSALADLLAARHPGTRLGAVLAQSQWAVDEEMVDDPAHVFLRGGEEVAVICPVSGG